MALTDEGGNGMVMPVQPMAGGYPYMGGGGGFGGFGGDFGGLLVLFLFAMMFGGGWGGGYGGGADGVFPWLIASNNNTDNLVQGGFNQAATAGSLAGLQAAVTGGFGDTALGIAGINQGICATGGQITAAVNNGFSQAEIAANARQIANMQQGFNMQTGITGAITDLAAQNAACCCENRLASANLQNVIQSENCADRAALSDGIRDVIASQTAATQKILDMMCQDKIDAKNEKILELQNQLNMANFQASQVAQNSYLQNALTAQTQYFLGLYPPPAPAAV